MTHAKLEELLAIECQLNRLIFQNANIAQKYTINYIFNSLHLIYSEKCLYLS